jgi:RNA polymerase sigma-B factor
MMYKGLGVTEPYLSLSRHRSVGSDPLESADLALRHLATLRSDDPRRERMRSDIICRCAPAARREAARYRHAGEPMDDLTQVAMVGLILAVDRFDARRQTAFKHFALPTIAGELKRHFRDRGWNVHVGRRLQELYQEVRSAEPELAQRLGRMPTVKDLAEHLRLSEKDIFNARDAGAAHTPWSLNHRPFAAFPAEDGDELGDSIGLPDPSIEAVADRDALKRALRILPQRLCLVLSMRFVDELTQAQIASKIGASQMQVSRLISRSLILLRRHMLAAPQAHAGPGADPGQLPQSTGRLPQSNGHQSNGRPRSSAARAR